MKNTSEALRISVISIIVNLALSLLKLIAGIFGHSQALIADAVHSASDVFSTVIVIISLKIASKKADKDHEYGHQKFENLGSLFLAILLGYLGLRIGISAVSDIYHQTYKTLALPTVLAAAAAMISIVVKELMYHATMSVAKKTKSNALKADAWHHRSDALSSIGSFVGVLFAICGFPIMDPIASILICIMILKTAIDIAEEAIESLTDRACSPSLEAEISKEVKSIPQVANVDLLRTRKFGSGYYIDIEIAVNGDIALREAHDIAEAVHDHVENHFPDTLHCMVHVNPV